MTFAEQRMLSLCIGIKNVKYSQLTTMLALHAMKNPYVTHLWTSKDIYKCFPDANKYYQDYLLNMHPTNCM